MTDRLTLLSSNLSFGGWHKRYQHSSKVLNCSMNFAIYLPPKASVEKDSIEKVPALYWLSGLTCTDENFMQKSGALRVAAELGIALIAPDTSPRGEGVPDDAEGAFDFGLAAGFYVNATQEPWSKHYHMHDYVVHELPELIEQNFPISEVRSVSGHSMGGHGALICALRNPGRYQSISAFAPISHPSQCPWGQKAFGHYLGLDKAVWSEWDSCELIKKAEEQRPLLIDQGLADDYLAEQLKVDDLEQSAAEAGYPIQLRRHEHYDHSYYFISSFIEEHLRYHGKYLK